MYTIIAHSMAYISFIKNKETARNTELHPEVISPLRNVELAEKKPDLVSPLVYS